MPVWSAIAIYELDYLCRCRRHSLLVTRAVCAVGTAKAAILCHSQFRIYASRLSIRRSLLPEPAVALANGHHVPPRLRGLHDKDPGWTR